MTVARPRSLDEAADALAALPDAHLLAGGTDFMVEVNFGHRRPADVVALRRVTELAGYDVDDAQLVLGANLTYAQMEAELAELAPALAAAARTVGSPQIRNAGTLGGNVGTASPAGDALPYLAALDAEVVLTAADGTRTMPIGEFITGPKRTAIASGELIREVRVPRVRGPQEFLKVGTRNAMVISIACCALIVDLDQRRVRCAFGSVAPRPLRPAAAEGFISGEIDWDRLHAPAAATRRFGELAAAAATPITDHRGTAEYRRHSVAIMAQRALSRSLRR